MVNSRKLNQARSDEEHNMNSKLWQQVYERLFAIYGKNPPELCPRRLEEERQALENTDAI